MARGSDHREDPEFVRDLYRQRDLEDLTRVIGWMNEADRPYFTADEVKRGAQYATVVGWGIRRIRRVLRVGVEIGWLRLTIGHRYEITEKAVSTLPTFEIAISKAVAAFGLEGDMVRHSLRKKLREQLRRAIDGERP